MFACCKERAPHTTQFGGVARRLCDACLNIDKSRVPGPAGIFGTRDPGSLGTRPGYRAPGPGKPGTQDPSPGP